MTRFEEIKCELERIGQQADDFADCCNMHELDNKLFWLQKMALNNSWLINQILKELINERKNQLA